VSILIAAGAGEGRCLGLQPRAKVSMIIMRPPQHGHSFLLGGAAAAWPARH
jgi:hypothetical protein